MKQFACRFTLAIIALLTFALNAEASYVEAELSSTHAQTDIGTHVVIAGRGLEAGKAWLMAAHTQALAFRERRRHGAIRLIAALDPNRREEYLQLLTKWGYEQVRVHEEDFTANELIDRLKELTLIASMDFIGHDGAFLGLALEDEGPDHRFYKADAVKLAKVAKFSKDSFVRLLGCNTGWFLAPAMAKALGVPVRGTLTSADVQLVYTSRASSNWFYDENGSQPSGFSASKQNSLSYPTSVSCVGGGGCVRLKPINASYVGQHGTYAGALPFGKFFCGTVPTNDCFRRMALSVEYAVSVNSMPLADDQKTISSLENFAAVLADDFCPPAFATQEAQGCREGVVQELNGLPTLPRSFTTLPRQNPQLACNFAGCEFKVGVDDRGQKILLSNSRGPSTTFTDELDAYRAGFLQLSSP